MGIDTVLSAREEPHKKMADHSTIILFPTLIVLLMSGHKVQGSVQDISFFKNTVGIVNRMAREGNITTHQKSAINNVVRILSEKTSQIVGGQTLEQIQRNFTAVERLAPIIEDQYQTYNNFVVYTLKLTSEDLHLSKDEFCKSVPKICDKTYEIPEELKIPEDLKINKAVTEADKEEVDELHKKDKEIVDEVNRLIASKEDKSIKNKKPEETTISTEAATKIPSSKEDTHEGDHHKGDHQHIDMTIYINSAGKPKSVVWNLIATIL